MTSRWSLSRLSRLKPRPVAKPFQREDPDGGGEIGVVRAAGVDRGDQFRDARSFDPGDLR